MTYDLLQQVCVYCLHCLTCALPVCHISVVITVGIVLNVLFFYYFRGPSTHGFIDPSAYPSIVINRQSRELYREVSSRPLIRSYCWTLRFAAQNRNIQAGWISWYDTKMGGNLRTRWRLCGQARRVNELAWPLRPLLWWQWWHHLCIGLEPS